MLVVTHQAARALRAAIDADESSETRVIRAHAVRNEAGEFDIRLEPDEFADDDKLVVFEDRVILVADPQGAAVLSGHTLTVEDRDGRARFALRKTVKPETPNGASDGEGADS